MILSTEIRTKQEFITSYLDLWIGSFKLTDKEKEVLSELLDIYLQLEEDGLQAKYANKILFSSDSRKLIRDKMKLSEPGLNNYFTQLKEKQVIFDNGRELAINQILVPKLEISFKFILKNRR